MSSGQVGQHDFSQDPLWLGVRGVRTAYRRRGSGAPVLYLHGSGLTKRWLPIHESLSQHFDLIAPEHPGYGDTVRPAWFRGLDDMVLHYLDLLDELGLKRVHVVGHSIGGRIAGAIAGLAPDRVLSLSLVVPAPLEPGGPSGPAPWEEVDETDPDALLFNSNQARYPDFLDGDDEGSIVDSADSDPHADPSRWSIDTPSTLYRRLQRLNCAARVIVPDEDRLIPHHFFAEWASYVPRARTVRVTGTAVPTGHLLVVQEPDAIAQVVRECVEEAEQAVI